MRAIQEAAPAINGDPFHCERDEGGACVKTNYCMGEKATAGIDCLDPAEEHAWSSPIYLDPPSAGLLARRPHDLARASVP